MRRSGTLVLAGAAWLGVAAVAGAQPAPLSMQRAAQLPGMFAELVLQGGFEPDPTIVEIEAGGTFEAADLDPSCSGRINAEAPDITVDFSRPVGPLNIYVLSAEDTTLVVRRPNGTWLCDDDTHDFNPLVRLEKPASGRYAIWVGNYTSVAFPTARVLISELEPEWEFDPPMAGEPDFGPPLTPKDVGLLAITLEGTRAAPMVERLLASITPLLNGADLVLGTEKPATVADDGTDLRITLPGLQLAGREGRARFGDVTVGLKPRDGGVFDLAFDVPRRVEAGDDGTAVLGVLEFGAASKVTGTWSSPLQTFTALRIEINAAKASEGTGRTAATRASLGGLLITRELSAAADGRWNGRYEFRLKDLSLTPNDDNGLQIATLTAAGTIEGVELAALAELNTTFGLDPMFGGADALDPIDLADYLDAALALGWGKYAGTFTLNDLVTREGGAAYTLGQAEVRTDIDLTGELGEMGLGLFVAGAGMDLSQWLPVELWPRSVSLDTRLTRVPLKTFLGNLARETMTTGRARARDRTEVAGPLLQELLAENRTALEVKNLTVRSDVLEVAATGTLALTADAGGLPTATFDATVRGLGKAIEAMRAGAPRLANGEAMLLMLILLRGLGQAEVADGAIVHRYHVVRSADGDVRVNGLSIDALMP